MFTYDRLQQSILLESAQGVENIAKIEIVELEDRKFSVICVIAAKDYDELVSDVQAMPAKRIWMESFGPYGKAVIITFDDGDYDLIAVVEPGHITQSNGTYKRNLRLHYDINEFNRLIEKWIAKAGA